MRPANSEAGAGEEPRTPYLDLGKVALYQGELRPLG